MAQYLLKNKKLFVEFFFSLRIIDNEIDISLYGPL